MGVGCGFPCKTAGLKPAWRRAPKGSRNRKALGRKRAAQNTFSAREKPSLVFSAAAETQVFPTTAVAGPNSGVTRAEPAVEPGSTPGAATAAGGSGAAPVFRAMGNVYALKMLFPQYI